MLAWSGALYLLESKGRLYVETKWEVVNMRNQKYNKWQQVTKKNSQKAFKVARTPNSGPPLSILYIWRNRSKCAVRAPVLIERSACRKHRD